MSDHYSDALEGVLVVEALDALLVHLRDGAVVARKNDGEYGIRGVVGEEVRLPVDAGQGEVGGGGADGEDRMIDVHGLGDGEDRSQKEKNHRKNKEMMQIESLFHISPVQT